MATNKNSKAPAISPKRRLLFRFILIIFPIALLVLMEFALRISSYGNSYKLFVEVPDNLFPGYKVINREIGEKYFNRFEYTKPPNDIFKNEKPDNGFRIFVLGSSTVVGFPYGYNLMFTRILHDRLQTLYPQKEIEVINTAITAINSHTLLDFTRMILREKPDAILIYAGHNEFYGALGVASNERLSSSQFLTQLHLRLLNYRSYQFVRNIIGSTLVFFSSDGEGDSDRGTLMTRIAGIKDIVYKSELYNSGIEQYQENMRAVVRLAQRRGVPVFISEVVSNVRDLPPFSSPASSDYPNAVEVFSKAREYEAQGQFSRAKDLYYTAKDLDGVRFRASEDINEVIRSIASEFGAHLVPMKEHFEANSPNGLIGNNLMTEHVHPNILGYFLMADAFYRSIAKSEVIGPFYRPNHRDMLYHKRNWGYTEVDSLIALHRVASLMHHWPFRPLDAPFVDYRLVYKPTNFLDSIAFNAIKVKDGGFFEAHRYLGKHYSKQNDHFNAYKEFYAAITIAPFVIEDFAEAIHSLVQIKDYSKASALVERMIQLEETFQGYFYRGEFQMMRHNFKSALEAYSKAAQFATKSSNLETLMQKQALAFYFDGQTNQAQRVIREIRKTNPAFQLNIPERNRHFITFIPNYIHNDVMLGLELFQNKNPEDALSLLLKTLSIRETYIANRTVAEILLSRNNPDAYIYFERAFAEFSKDIAFLNNMLMSLVKVGEKSRASEVLALMQRINPSFERLPRLKQMVDGME